MKHIIVIMTAIAALSGCAANQQKNPQSAAPAQAAAPAIPSQEVKGINGWSGQINGSPVANSKFNKLKIGMGFSEVTDLIGKPTSTSSHITGKAWIPFYYGSGKYETIFYYKGIGHLIFAGGAGMYRYGYNDAGSGLTVIQHDGAQRGYE